MALSTIEKQRLRAAMNNTPLSNRIEEMLNYVDQYSEADPSINPTAALKIDLSADFHEFSCDEGAAFSEDLSALIVQGQATQWDILGPFGFESVNNAGTLSGTAPAFTGSGDIYGITVICSNNFNYKIVSAILTVVDVP